MNNVLKVGGWFSVVCRNRFGAVRWEERFKNGVCNAALTNLLDVYMRQQANSTWYIGLIDGSGYTALAAADTAASHAGWAESSDYTAATRQAWAPSAAASQSITNSTPVTLTINATKTLKGAFLISESTKGGVAGTLLCTGLFTQGDRSVVNLDTLAITYTFAAASA